MKSNEQFIKENVSTVRKGYQMMETMLKIIDILQHSDFVAGTALEKQIDTPVKASLEWLEQLGKVKTEKRKEEFITVTNEEYVWRDKNGNILPKTVTITFDGNEYMFPNPKIKEMDTRGRWEKVEKQVQVTRKYYKWVG